MISIELSLFHWIPEVNGMRALSIQTQNLESTLRRCSASISLIVFLQYFHTKRKMWPLLWRQFNFIFEESWSINMHLLGIYINSSTEMIRILRGWTIVFLFPYCGKIFLKTILWDYLSVIWTERLYLRGRNSFLMSKSMQWGFNTQCKAWSFNQNEIIMEIRISFIILCEL